MAKKKKGGANKPGTSSSGNKTVAFNWAEDTPPIEPELAKEPELEPESSVFDIVEETSPIESPGASVLEEVLEPEPESDIIEPKPEIDGIFPEPELSASRERCQVEKELEATIAAAAELEAQREALEERKYLAIRQEEEQMAAEAEKMQLDAEEAAAAEEVKRIYEEEQAAEREAAEARAAAEEECRRLAQEAEAERRRLEKKATEQYRTRKETEAAEANDFGNGTGKRGRKKSAERDQLQHGQEAPQLNGASISGSHSSSRSSSLSNSNERRLKSPSPPTTNGYPSWSIFNNEAWGAQLEKKKKDKGKGKQIVSALDAEAEAIEDRPPTPPPAADMDIPIKTIVEGGDTIIYNASQQIQYRVASQVLWTTSPVFRRMLGPDSQFKEAITLRRYGLTIVPTDDNMKILLLVLQVLHHQYDQLPSELDYEEMVAVAVIADKYEVARALKFVAKGWSDCIWPMDRNFDRDRIDWLLISWVFDYEDDFTIVSRGLIRHGEWTRAVGLTFGTEGDWTRTFSEFMSEAVIARIATVREQAIQKMRSYIHNLEKELHEGKCSGWHGYKAECDTLQLGHFVATCRKHHLQDSATWNSSLESIMEVVDSIPMWWLPSYSDERCSWVPAFKEFMKETLGEVKGLTFEDFPSKKRGL